MRLTRIAAIAAIAFTALIVRADARPNGTWVGVPASLAPAGSPQVLSVRATPASGTAINVHVVYACAGHPNCSFDSPAVLIPPNMYVTPNPLPATAPRQFFVVLDSLTSCQTTYGATALAAVWAGAGGAQISECMVPPTYRAPSGGGGGPRPAPLPQLRLPRIPPYVERPVLPPTPSPGPIPPH